MNKTAIVTDIQANLPALKAFVKAVDEMNITRIINLGDVVSIGPHPKECLDVVLRDQRFINIKGNHDEVLEIGVEQAAKKYQMNDGEKLHQKWTYDQIDDSDKKLISLWKLNITEIVVDKKIFYCHYAIKDGSFKEIVPEKRYLAPANAPSADQLDEVFDDIDADIIICGHDHYGFDVFSPKSNKRYINPGSLGCYHQNEGRFIVLSHDNNGVDLNFHKVSYKDQGLIDDYLIRGVPEKEFIIKNLLWRK